MIQIDWINSISNLYISVKFGCFLLRLCKFYQINFNSNKIYIYSEHLSRKIEYTRIYNICIWSWGVYSPLILSLATPLTSVVN